VLFMGDFNVNAIVLDAHSDPIPGVSSAEYLELVRSLQAERGALRGVHTQSAPGQPALKFNTEPRVLPFVDVLFEVNKTHEVTFGAIKVLENGTRVSDDQTLTVNDERCSQQRLDYIFWESGLSGIAVSKVRVEAMYTNAHILPVTQLSDHFGVSAVLALT